MHCGFSAHFNGPITPNSAGNFVVTGVSHLTPAVGVQAPTIFTGTINNGKMTVNFFVKNDATGAEDPSDSFVLTLGQTAPTDTTFGNACPG